MGKNVFVTGGSGLIGSAIVNKFKESGYNTINIDQSEGADMVLNLDIDFFKSNDLDVLFENLDTDDVWINSIYPGSWEEHIVAYHVLTTYTAMIMAELNGGCIINLSSIYSINGIYPYLYTEDDGIQAPPLEYCMVKGAINSLTKAVSTKYGEMGVRANSIIAGGVNDNHKERDVNFHEQYCFRVPLGRMAEPEDIAHAALFLAENNYITGHELIVDGGYTSW